MAGWSFMFPSIMTTLINRCAGRLMLIIYSSVNSVVIANMNIWGAGIHLLNTYGLFGPEFVFTLVQLS